MAEAMASGCPVVTSRGTAMEEFATPDAILIEPLEADEVKLGMQQVVALSSARVPERTQLG